MANMFLKKEELKLVNGGYLVNTKDESPVFHAEFVQLQKEAHYLVNLSNAVKVADFQGKQPVSFQSVVNDVTKSLNNEKRTFVENPKSVATPTIDKLQKEALAWLGNQENESKVNKINRILQKFNAIAEFEEFGLYFSTDEIVKLPALYSLEQIVEAVTVLEPHLD
jgi:hypothetical protein